MSIIKTTTQNRIAHITLNRPDKRNALNGELVDALHKAFNDYEDDDSVKVIVLKAEGKAFCAGADLASLQQLQQNSYEENLEDSKQLKDLFYRIYHHPKPVIAQVQGHAIAGGCGLATVCDFVYSVPEARFGYTEVRIGFVPAIVAAFLIRKVGEGIARELLLSGELYRAEEAMQKGLISQVVEAETLDNQVQEFAEHLAQQNSGEAMKRTKQLLSDLQNQGLEDGLEHAAMVNAWARESTDCQHGIQTFLNKKELKW